jgi:hypothetical protein
MLKLLQTFVDIALWRKGPQDLPASGFLAWLTLAAYVATSIVQVELAHPRMSEAILVIAVDVVMLLGWLWVVLAFFGRRERFVQTAAAVLGAGTVMSLLDTAVQALALSMGPGNSTGNALGDVWNYVRFFGYALVFGRIFMHALERGMFTGIALTFGIIYSTFAVTHLTLLQLRGH